MSKLPEYKVLLRQTHPGHFVVVSMSEVRNASNPDDHQLKSQDLLRFVGSMRKPKKCPSCGK